MRQTIIFAAVNGALAVMAGAFAAHGLDPVRQAEAIRLLKTAADYQLLHALALLAVAALKAPRRVAFCFAAGIVLFSGSLYAMAATGWPALGIVTPVGGLLLIAGWLLLAMWAWKLPRRTDIS